MTRWGYPAGVAELAEWFLTTEDRGNPATNIPAWCAGNRAQPLIHGATYFDQLVTEVEALGEGDYLFFTDWRGDPDEKLRDDGPTIAELFCKAAERGVVVKGLMWRSHLDKFAYSEEENQHLGDAIERAGGEVLLDQRVRFGGSHHQKLVVIRHRDNPERDVAFAGGIDLCHSRRDDESHRGDPQAVQMSKQYGEHPPWHDVQLRVQGPVVGALDTTFRERWTDPAPLDMLSPDRVARDKLRGADLKPEPLPEQPPDPPPCGPHKVQVLRTYPDAHFEYDFAPHGERSIAHGYIKVVPRARKLIYLEDQYLWSKQVAELFASALAENPELHLVAVVPRHPDVDGRLALPPNQLAVIRRWRRAAGEPRSGAYLRRRKPRRHTRLRACQGLRHRRRLGLCRKRQPEPAVVDARQRTVVCGAGRRRSVRTRPSITTAARAPRPCRPTAARTTALSTRHRRRDDWRVGESFGRLALRWPQGPGRRAGYVHTSGAPRAVDPPVGGTGIPRDLRPRRPVLSRSAQASVVNKAVYTRMR